MRLLATIIIIGLALSSCSTLEIATDYNKNVNFKEFKTLEYYGWAGDSDSILNRFDKERIETAFGNEFRKRGIGIVEKGDGDMIVALFIIAKPETTTKAVTSTGFGGYGTYNGYGPGYGWGGGHSTTTFDEYNYTVGTLVIAIYDSKKEELIWKSIGQKTVDEDPKNREKRLGKTIAKIMEGYPIKPIK